MSERRLQIEVPGSGPVSALATFDGDLDPAYVLAHGAGADMNHRFMQRVAEGLAQRRIATLRFQCSCEPSQLLSRRTFECFRAKQGRVSSSPYPD
jgi:predicted alpha/beta-hydrolase family hydrolase